MTAKEVVAPMPSSVTSGSNRGYQFFWWILGVGLLTALGWFTGCGSDVKQAHSAAATGSGGSTSGTTEATGVGGDFTTGTGGDTGTGGSGDVDSGTVIPPPPKSERVDLLINDGWKFIKSDAPGADQPMFNDGTWTTVNVPHSWNVVDGQDGPGTTPAYYRGLGWYRKHYTIPADIMQGKKIYLQFDGVGYITNVWVNGTKVGAHSGGYAGFRFDITNVAKLGADNVIAVQVDNAQAVDGQRYNFIQGASTANMPPRSGDFTFFGGIYRYVHVLATDPLAISPMDYGSSGVYLKTTNVSAASADLTATIKLLNGSAAPRTASVELTLLDPTGMMTLQTFNGMQSVPANGAADLVINAKIMNPHLWDGMNDPYVYRVNVVVKDGDRIADAVGQPLGFRFFKFDPNTGFSLNGKPYPLRGICMHQDHKGKGGSYSPRDIDNDFAMVKEMGANCIRFAHYQHPQYTYDKADQMGIVGWAENAVVDSLYDTPAYFANAKQQLQEVIRQSYNHPSLFIWALSNEILLRLSHAADGTVLTAAQRSMRINDFVTQLNQLAHQEDPTRMTINSCANNDQDDPINFITDINAFNTYNGWYYKTIADFAPWADAKHAMYPTKLIAVAEYGVGSSIIQHGLPIVETGTNRTAGVQSEEYGAIFHERHWKMIQARPWIVWTSIWNMFDFAADYRNEGLVPGLNTKGLVTYDRQTRKDPFYWYKANWTKDPFVHINYRRFTTMPKSATEIRVYSNQAEVELKLNGNSLGKKQAPDHLFIWTGVTWAAGANVVDAIAGAGITDQVTWMN
jgi:beta-galactosidase